MATHSNYHERIVELGNSLGAADSPRAIAQVWRVFHAERRPEYAADIDALAEQLRTRHFDDAALEVLRPYIEVDAAIAIAGIEARLAPR